MTEEELEQEIFDKITNELAYSGVKWGQEFDDKNTINDWSTYIGMYMGKACEMGLSPEEQEVRLVKVAGLTVSALKSLKRNGKFPPRHYE